MNRLNHAAGPVASRPAARRAAIHGALASLLLAACSTPSGTPVPMTKLDAPPPAGAAPEPIGELLFSGGRSATYSLYRVSGPKVNLSWSNEGRWVGIIDGRDVFLTPAPGRLTGPNVDLHLTSEGDEVAVRGVFFQRRISLRISPKALNGNAGGPAFDMTRTAANLWSGRIPSGIVSLEARGNAQQFPNVPMPQFALALIAALP